MPPICTPASISKHRRIHISLKRLRHRFLQQTRGNARKNGDPRSIQPSTQYSCLRDDMERLINYALYAKSSLTLIVANTNKNIKPDASAKTNTLIPPPFWQYVLTCNLTMFTRRDVFLSAEQLILSGYLLVLRSRPYQSWWVYNIQAPSQSLINKDFLGPAWKESVMSTQSLQLRAASYKVVNVDIIVPQLVGIDDLCVRACFWIVENLSLDVFVERLLSTDVQATYFGLHENSSLGIRDPCRQFRRRNILILYTRILYKSMRK